MRDLFLFYTYLFLLWADLLPRREIRESLAKDLGAGAATATCDKAGQPNDVCPCGQVMSASPNDVAFGYDVVPSAHWANITSLATIGSNITMSKTNNITFA